MLFVLFVCFVPAFVKATADEAGHFWFCGEGKPCRPDLMGKGIAPYIEPPSASSEVHPPLGKPPPRVGTDMKPFRPFTVVQRIGIRVGYPGLSSVMELGFVAQATVGTRNVKHKIIFSGQPRPLHVRR